MFYLLATILTNTILFALFKIFPRYKIDNLQAIVANYFTCVIIGCIFLGAIPFKTAVVSDPWFPWCILMGLTFITVFNLIAFRTREDGMTIATIANKLSLVIPVIFSCFLYKEDIGSFKMTGILIAFPAIYFTAYQEADRRKPGNIYWPALLFVASGLLDTLIKYVQHYYLSDAGLQAMFTVYAFLTAAIAGFILIAVLRIRGRIELRWRNVLAGIILGMPNYFSIYFLFRLLHSGFLQSSAAIPVNNIGIVVGSALIAICFFREKATPKRILGLALSVIAILLIAFGDVYGASA